ncbi:MULTISPECIES: hypothetical protein [unclassified Streptomyces]|uniref:hypothetical protein n=1 Tax=unclassified Streptomyces TaxID=2593676 RepID=UPI001BE846C7|nr:MULTISPECIES: hypothetical protein [unclassified Streptomyces]MBT2405608.1 hypothetical protein [Streptomyces sp. ISL-21]MBT2607712.1 hypothetical protein [Streptomyces sp. ISL-87]
MSADIFVIEPRWTVQAPHLRCTLKRGLALQATQNVWSDTEHINNAVAMAYANELPDSGRWLLTRSQLRTLKIAIEWRRGTRAANDRHTAPDILEHWTEIEDQVIEAYRAASHAEGLYWI